MLLFVVLLAPLCLCVWHDVRRRRIPNHIVFPATLAALVLHAVLPTGNGLFGTPAGALGLASAVGGLALGMAVLMPMYAMRLMGAGDVKMLGMVGAFVGAGQILSVAVATLLAGGALALAMAAWQGKLRHVLANTRQMVIVSGLAALAGTAAVAPAAASGRMPYAVAIAAAAVACVAWLNAFGSLPL